MPAKKKKSKWSRAITFAGICAVVALVSHLTGTLERFINWMKPAPAAQQHTINSTNNQGVIQQIEMSGTNNRVVVGNSNFVDLSSNNHHHGPTRADIYLTVEAVLTQMDTNRIWATQLLVENSKLKKLADEKSMQLGEIHSNLLKAEAAIMALSNQLVSLLPTQNLSPADQGRVSNALAVARSVRPAVILSGRVRLNGRVRAE